MNFFKKLFGKKPGHSCCGKCNSSPEDILFSSEDAVILQNADPKIVIGRIHAIASHPDPSITKVRVTQTEVAPGKMEQILCGGVNIEEGAYVPVATLGAKLSEDFQIGERNIKGEISRGMICSRTELGLTQNGEPDHGIWILDENKFENLVGLPIKELA
jgi:phenylalanyl-tRNA synthetase beta chain